MTLEAPKSSTLVDDFRYRNIDSLLWSTTGSPSIEYFETSVPRGLRLDSSSSVTSYNGVGGRRLDLYDSEIVWTINQWNASGLATFQIQNAANTYGYRFEFQSGLLTVRSVEAGVTYSGANFVDGSGNIALWPYSGPGTIRYLRIAHSATTGKIEFFAGFSPDGSDQRLFTSDLGTGVKGTLIATQNNLDSMIVTMSVGSGGAPLLIGSVNAPNEGLNRYPDSPTTFYARDFSTWVGYASAQFLNTTGLSNHEWYIRSAGSSSQIIQETPATKSLRISGTGTLSSLVTHQLQGLKNVNIKVTAGALIATDFESMYGISWRNGNTIGNYVGNMARYQLTILPGSVSLDLFPSTVGASTSYESTSVTRLAVATITNTTGVKYNWEINHFEDRILIKRNGVELISYTDIASSWPVAGNIGICAGSVNPASGQIGTAVIDKIEVTEAYDDQNFTRGAMLQDRKIGFHVKKNYRSGYIPMTTTPSVVTDLENQLGVPNNNTVYLYTSITAGNTGAIDGSVILAAQQYAREGRTIVICINSIGDQISALNPLNFAWTSALDAWATAINTIGATVYLAIMPFPDLNTPWSPMKYTARDTAAVGTTNTVINTTGYTPTAGTLVGKSIRFSDAAGIMYWSTITANTTSTITFTSVGSTPTGYYWVSTDSNISGGHPSTPANYVAAYRNIVTYLKSKNTRAYYVFAMNYNPISEYRAANGKADTTLYDQFYPGNAYVDAFLIRAIQSGTHIDMSTNLYESMWQPLDVMLEGRTVASGSTDRTTPVPQKSTPYYKMNASDSSKRMFLLTGCAETNEYYTDLNYGIPGEVPSSGFDFGVNTMSTNSFIRYWQTTSISQINPRKPNTFQRGIRVIGGTTVESFFGWQQTPTNFTNSKIVSLTCYYRIASLGAANAGYVMALRSTAPAILVGIRVDQATGAIGLANPANPTGLSGGSMGTLIANTWYRLELHYCPATGVVVGNKTEIQNEGSDRPLNITSTGTNTIGVLSIGTAVFGNMLSNTTNVLTGDTFFQELKLSLDMKASSYSKQRWLKEALETRGFPQIDTTIFVSADRFQDIPAVIPLSAGEESIYSQTYTGLVDTRIDPDTAISFTAFKAAFNVPDPKRLHSAPQVLEMGYSPSASVGNLEYMYLKETGYVPLYLTPRVGGILLRDFNLGSSTVRSVQEDRPGGDGIRDFSKFLGAKAISLSFVVFDDASGSASFYADALASWANPRRRPVLVYKYKDSVERSIRLRPETSDGSWVVDGVRSGFKEITLSMVGVDGKDYATARKDALFLPGTAAALVSNGTAPTPPVIRIWGGASGATNPSLILQSEERQQGKALARLSLGTPTIQFMIPANQFIEINVENRTAQLNGESGEGNSMLRYFNEKQWFYIDTYYNILIGNDVSAVGFFQVFWADAYL